MCTKKCERIIQTATTHNPTVSTDQLLNSTSMRGHGHPVTRRRVSYNTCVCIFSAIRSQRTTLQRPNWHAFSTELTCFKLAASGYDQTVVTFCPPIEYQFDVTSPCHTAISQSTYPSADPPLNASRKPRFRGSSRAATEVCAGRDSFIIVALCRSCAHRPNAPAPRAAHLCLLFCTQHDRAAN
jgi:hypothetical protein